MTVLWWIRRDLRLNDNHTLNAALKKGVLLPVFILDPHFGHNTAQRRYRFLINGLRALDTDLRGRGSCLVVRRGNPLKVLTDLLHETGAKTIYAEEDFTPYARKRDREIASNLPLNLIQGQLVHHPMGIHKPDGRPYMVYTPYSKIWQILLPIDLTPILAPKFIPTIDGIASETLKSYPPEIHFPVGENEAHNRLKSFLSDRIFRYGQDRNILNLERTSSLSPYIHFGMLGLRTAVHHARQSIEKASDPEAKKSAQFWLDELIWREFYIHILFHFPQVTNSSFRTQYEDIPWRNVPDEFQAWKDGLTGFPVVDAAMRQLLAIGWMHNRARMIVASFLVKHLLIDWRWGETWFMENLLDGDIAANNGGWQWTAGTGTDAAPYFRIFNPILQSKKFDPQGDYIRTWVPELAHLDSTTIHFPWEHGIDVDGYPPPIVDHKYARERTLAAYQKVRV